MRRALPALLALLVLPAAAAASPPDVTGRAWFVQNGSTGEVLLRHNDRAPVAVASITKLMTVLVALERSRTTDVVTVSSDAASVGESTISLRPGEQVTVGDLVEAALIQSANDAAWALAVYAGGGSADRFVRLMNAKARALGLRETHFVRPDGLDAVGHVSSARDVTVLARVAMRNPVIRSAVARRADVAAGRTLHTWNDLLGRLPGVVGVKTGHTSAAGWSQVAALRGTGFTLYATLLGSPTRAERNTDLTELLEWGVDQYRLVELVRAGRVYARAETAYGRGSVPLVAARPLRRLVRVGRPLVERIVAPRSVSLPVRRGEPVGSVRLLVGGQLVGSRALVAARSVDRPGVFARARWTAGRTLDELGGLFS